MIVTADDFNLFVEMHGPIEPHAFVIVHSGWSQYFFSDNKTYEDNATCLDESAIDWLIENAPDMKGFGMEALSPECNKEGLMLVSSARFFIFECRRQFFSFKATK